MQPTWQKEGARGRVGLAKNMRRGDLAKKNEKDGENDATHLAQAVTISNQR